MKIFVAGSGGWGTALALTLSENHEVTIWSFFEKEAEELKLYRENKPFLPGITLPESINITTDLSLASGAELIVLASPSFAAGQTARNLRPFVTPGTIVVNVAKGLHYGTGTPRRLSEIICEELSGTGIRFAALSGPSHAEEVGRKMPTTVVSASEDIETAIAVQDAFMTSCFRVYTSNDLVSVELGGALKNIIAIAAGVVAGMGLGDNPVAALMTRGIAEMSRLGVAMGGHMETFAGLSGIGDLIVTCTSQHSRNRRAGVMLGQGMNMEDIIKKVGGVVEGYYATQAAYTLGKALSVDLPITNECYNAMYLGKSPQESIFDLMTRAKRHESERVFWGA